MKERCGYTIVVWISGQRREITCNPNEFCLRELLWSGKGIKGTASEILNVPPSEVSRGTTEGACKYPPKE